MTLFLKVGVNVRVDVGLNVGVNVGLSVYVNVVHCLANMEAPAAWFTNQQLQHGHLKAVRLKACNIFFVCARQRSYYL